MPVYEYYCQCGYETAELQEIGDQTPECPTCGVGMTKRPSRPAIIRVLSKGGYPVRSRGYKEGYSKEVLRDVSPETHA